MSGGGVKVVVPVAGEGTRLRPHTHSVPKPLLSVAGKPILAHVLDPVLPLQPEEVIFVVGYRGEMIEQWVRDKYDFNATFVQQDQLLGLGYAVNMAMAHVSDEPVLIVLGDTIVQCDLTEFTGHGDYVLGLRQVDDPQRFGIAVLEDGRIIDLEEKPEKPKSNLAVIGLYYIKDSAAFNKALARHVKSGKTVRGEIQLTDALHQMIEQGHDCLPFEVQAWYDCGKKETMIATNHHLLDQLEPPKDIDDSITPPVYIHETAKISDSKIGPYVSIGANTVISNSTISHSLVGRDAEIKHSDLTDSLIGNNVQVNKASGRLNIGDHSELDLQ